MLGVARTVRCSVSTFSAVGALVEGTALVATVPDRRRGHRARAPAAANGGAPFSFAGAGMEMLWPAALDDDEACTFVRTHVARIAASLARG